MNKPLVAALSGVFFGAVLGGIAVTHYTQCHSHRMLLPMTGCSRHAVAPVLPPAPPIPSCGASQAPAASAPALTDPAAASIDQQLSQAQTDYVNGNFQQAVQRVLPLTSQSPERAFRIIGAAACNLRDEALADRAYRNLHSAGRQYLIYVCHRQQLARIDGHFTYQP